MKVAASTLLLFSFAGANSSQADEVPSDEIHYSAISMHRDGPLQTLVGEARIETATVTITADKAIIDTDTMDVTPTGNVHVILKK